MKKLLSLVLLLFIIEGVLGEPFPKIVWSYWDGGFQTSNILINLLSGNHHEFLEINGWELRQIDKNSVMYWLEKIPDFPGFPSVDMTISKGQVKANLIRLYLLKHYGGVWIDTSIIFLQNLSWLEKLSENPYIENRSGQQPKIFMFHLQTYGSAMEYVDEQNKKFLLSPGLETWFFAAVPNTQFISHVLEQYLTFLTKGIQYKKQFLKSEGIETRKMQRMGNYITFSQAIQAVLQLKQRQLNNLPGSQGPKKISVVEYGIWTINSKIGPHQLQQKIWWNSSMFLRLMYEKRMEQLKVNGLNPLYMIKISRQPYLNLLTILEEKNIFTDLIHVIRRKPGVSLSSWNSMFCPEVQEVYPGSIIAEYLYSINPLYEQKYEVIKQRNNIPKVCHPHFTIKACLVLFPILLIFTCIISFLLRKKYLQPSNNYIPIRKKQENSSTE